MIHAHSSTVIFTLDPPPWQHGGPAAGSQDFSSGSERRKVVVVDDESTIADTLVEILNGEGFDAVAASTGLDAIAVAQKVRPHIVLSDVVIPGLDGVETGIRIRTLFPDCRIILFSGQAATLDLLKAARERGHDFEILVKPIKPEVLLSILRQRPPSGQAD
ncbi:MAG: response regulator [Candidatus Acidiferrales bacterium]|jgi:CheY-like chemotaxis protein